MMLRRIFDLALRELGILYKNPIYGFCMVLFPLLRRLFSGVQVFYVALGMAIARDLQHEDYRVAAVVGDGALTGGMSMEGLFHAGHEQRKMLLILKHLALITM